MSDPDSTPASPSDQSALSVLEQALCAMIIRFVYIFLLDEEQLQRLQPHLNRLRSHRASLLEVFSVFLPQIQVACRHSLESARVVQNVIAESSDRPGRFVLVRLYEQLWMLSPYDQNSAESRPEVQRWVSLMAAPLPTDPAEFLELFFTAIGAEEEPLPADPSASPLDLFASVARLLRAMNFLDTDAVWEFDRDVELVHGRQLFSFSSTFTSSLAEIAHRFDEDGLLGQAAELKRDAFLAGKKDTDDFPFQGLRWDRELNVDATAR